MKHEVVETEALTSARPLDGGVKSKAGGPRPNGPKRKRPSPVNNGHSKKVKTERLFQSKGNAPKDANRDLEVTARLPCG